MIRAAIGIVAVAALTAGCGPSRRPPSAPDPLDTVASAAAEAAEELRLGRAAIARDSRLAAFERGLAAAERCSAIAPSNPTCDYWVGFALLLRARELRAAAAPSIPRLRRALERVAADAPEMEGGGADRNLALLYADAPRPPFGPGNPERAVAHAQRALALAPLHPGNSYALGAALAAIGRSEEALAAYGRAAELARATPDLDGSTWLRQAEAALAGTR